MPSIFKKNKPNNIPRENGVSREILLQVFDSMEEGVLVISPTGNLLYSNSAARTVFGMSGNELEELVRCPGPGFMFFDLDKKRLPKEQCPFNKLFAPGGFQEERFFLSLPQKTRHTLARFRGRLLYKDNGELDKGLLLVKDITEEEKTRVDLEHEMEFRSKHDQEIGVYQHQLDREKRLLETIINTIPVMITIYDERIEGIFLNKAVEDITGWTNEDALLKNIMELVYPDPVYRKEIQEFMQSLQPGFKDIFMHTKDGRDIETSWANVRIPDGRQVGVGIDISGRKCLEKELIKAKEKAEKENVVQTAFIQNISHEVRTPMNSILGFAELLQKTVQGETEKQYLDSISHNGQQLLRLIDDIVDFSRLDKNEM
jgi:PAS domain S-box-containing protein